MFSCEHLEQLANSFVYGLISNHTSAILVTTLDAGVRNFSAVYKKPTLLVLDTRFVEAAD